MPEPAAPVIAAPEAAWHQRAELARILDGLGRLLAWQRRRGRTAAADPVDGFVIEDGEAEGLLGELETALGTAGRSGDEGGAAGLADRRREIDARANAAAAQGVDLPLRRAARAFRLSPAEYDAFLLALCVEQDARFGRLVAYLNDHAGRTRPTVGLALALANVAGVAVPDPVHLLDRPLVADGLVDVEGDGPLPSLELKLPRALLERLVTPAVPDTTSRVVTVLPPEPGLLHRLVLDDALRQRLMGWVGTWKGQETRFRRDAGLPRPGADGRDQGPRHQPAGPAADAPGHAARPPGTAHAFAPRAVITGAPGSGRCTAARALASEAGLPLVIVQVAGDAPADALRIARRESRWHDAAVLLRVADPAGRGLDPGGIWAQLEPLGVPVFVACSPALARELAAARPQPPAVLALDPPDAEARLRLWKAMLPRDAGVGEAGLDQIATKFRFTPRGIAVAARRALADAAATTSGEPRVTQEILERACRDEAASQMGALAQKLPLPYRRADLVVPPELGAELDLALSWVRQERKVLDEWGFRDRLVLGRGLTALFAGPPGTGKTMTAQVLARELGLDLYRVDLSRVMSKFIGETEKNLARLFDGAQSSVLFFDEADALFGKRSEVKDAHDRYANVEIGYLLQRMEEHDGVTVLASNRMRDMDEAFVRRFHVIAHFPMPGEQDRLRIWEGMFPPGAPRAADLDLARLAREFEVSGGEIKNAALAAAYLAAEHDEPISMTHVRRTIRREIVKSGRVG